MTPWTLRLLITNVVVFFITSSNPAMMDLLALYPPRIIAFPWMAFTAVTYMFLHAGTTHLLFNMLVLFFFGPRLEARLGGKGFLLLYFASGLGGAAFSFVLARQAAVVGASAAIYGVMVGFARYWPRMRIYIWFVLPVEAWMLVLLALFASLYFGFNPATGSRTAHFAHLGGLVAGYLFLRWWEWHIGAAKRSFQKQMRVEPSGGGLVGDRTALARWKGISVDSLHELNRGEVIRLLDKVEQDGAKSLTQSEREFLDRMARR
ncbi:MAG: rhomboid family intramembrane serine protease [Gemmatimonadota bacterium]